MPYIPQEDRDLIYLAAYELLDEITTPGEFAYALTLLLNRYVGKQADFTSLSEGIGVYESVKLEFYRRRMAPYEDIKCAENGDVY